VFQLTYMARELRRRLGRTILTALGLAAGVGLVIGIIGVSQGLEEAQAGVLAPLQTVGTDILVTRVAAPSEATAPGTAPSVTQEGPGPGFFGPGGAQRVNRQDADALLAENNNVITDLSKLGKPGDKFTHDFFLSSTLLSFPDDAIDKIKAVAGVTGVAGGLTQQVQHQSGTVPEIVAQIQTGGNTVTQNVTPAPLTPAEEKALQACIAKNQQQGPAPQQGDGPRFGPGVFGKCMPERFRNFRASFMIPRETIRQVVDPPQTDITNESYTAAGIDPATPGLGLVTKAQLTTGRWVSPAGAHEVLLNTAYANRKTLKVGSKLAINGTSYTVVGLVNPTLTGSTADVYFPLATLQKLAAKAGRVTQVLVKAKDSKSVDAVAAAIKKVMPGAEVVTTKSLADSVTGSLTDARKLADRLGGALGAIVLIAAFAIAVLLTLSSIAKRVREIGTLRAIGWSRGRVVRQVLSETVGIGVIGGVIGIALGFAAAAAVGAFSPELSATTTGASSFGTPVSSILFGPGAQSVAKTSTLKLHAPVHLTTLALGVAFAIIGGLLAGGIGGWRASRLSPAEALRNVG
jgi:putative ABC transport system permease protein